MLEQGVLCFSCAETWANITNIGQGDPDEGMFARLPREDSRIAEYEKMYRNNLLKVENGEFVDLKLKTVMRLPAFCFYSLKIRDVECELKEGVQRVSSTLPADIFKDFANGKTKSEIQLLPQGEQPAFIAVYDTEQFKYSIVKALLNLGVKQNDILPHHVTYVDRQNREFISQALQPNELFIKDKAFEYQNETRIVVNSRSHRLKSLDKPLIVQIGDMRNFAKICEGYFTDGIRIDYNIDLIRVD